MNFDLNINVQIGVTPQLATFLTALLQSRPATPVQLPATEAPAPEQPAESEKPRRTRRAKADAPEAAAPVAAEEVPEPEAQQPAGEPKPFAEVPAQQPEKELTEEELTEEDIRTCMHRTRQRFEGEDYKENTDSEAYKKYHKQLTGMFKQIAAVLGADKPSALPADKRVTFIAECNALIIDENGFIAPPSPY